MHSTSFRSCVDGPSNVLHSIPHLRGRSFQCIPLHSALAWMVLPMYSNLFRSCVDGPSNVFHFIPQLRGWSFQCVPMCSDLWPAPGYLRARLHKSPRRAPPPGKSSQGIASPRISSPLPSHTVWATQCGPPYTSAAEVQRTSAPLQPRFSHTEQSVAHTSARPAPPDLTDSLSVIDSEPGWATLPSSLGDSPGARPAPFPSPRPRD